MPAKKAPVLLLSGLACDSLGLVEEAFREESQQVISLGNGEIRKFSGICSGKRDLRIKVRWFGGK